MELLQNLETVARRRVDADFLLLLDRACHNGPVALNSTGRQESWNRVTILRPRSAWEAELQLDSAAFAAAVATSGVFKSDLDAHSTAFSVGRWGNELDGTCGFYVAV
jgi:hypothetical protein